VERPHIPRGIEMKTLLNRLSRAATFTALFVAVTTTHAASIGSSLADAIGNAADDDKIGVLIELRSRANLESAAASVARSDRNARSAAVIGALRSTADASQRGLLDYLDRQQAAGNVEDITAIWIVNVVSASATPAVIKTVAARPEVASVKLDESISLPPVQPGADEPTVNAAEWGISRVGAPVVWNFLGTRGEGSVVGILDTGVDPDHPDLLNGPDAWFDAVNGLPAPYDDHDHGSHVTGTSVGGNAGGSDIGVAPGARYISCKAFNSGGSGSSTDILQCMQWFTDPDGNPGTADYPDVVNNSWSAGSSFDNTFAAGVQAWRALGIFPAFAAGNSGPGVGSISSPGQNPESFAVGATDIADVIASFSGRGPSSCDGTIAPEVSAPGVNIRSSVDGGGYANFNGTSMATPHVAGCIALIRSAANLEGACGLPAIAWETFLLRRFATDLGSAGPDNAYGAGRLNCAPPVLAAARIEARCSGP
jgi:subtilisin family serine protease